MKVIADCDMTANLLSAEDCTKILHNRFNNKDIQFISFEIKPISENAEGFLGEHYNLNITYKLNNKTDTEVLFIKTVPTKSDIQIQVTNDYQAYKKEIFFYDILLREFEKYGYNTDFAAKCYYCIPEKSLIFENLVHKGFVLSERKVVFDLQRVESVLKALALFHAAGFAYQKDKTKELGHFSFEDEFSEYLIEIFFGFYANPEHSTAKWWNARFTSLNTIIDLLPKDDAYKQEFKDLLNKFPFGKIFTAKSKLPKTCGHGDLWSNNMLFKFENGKVVDSRLLDFQLGRYFYPSFDVLLVIFANTNSEFRTKHLDELYEYYYSVLGDTMKTYSYSIQDILPKKDFYESIRLVKLDALAQVIWTILALYLPKEVLTSFVNDNNGAKFKDFLEDNTKICCDAFLNNEEYRNIVSEILLDIRTALLETKR